MRWKLPLLIVVSAAFAFIGRVPLPRGYAFEAQLTSSAAGQVRVYFDLGRGLNEADSAGTRVPAGETVEVRITLPEGDYRELRFDPIDGPADVRFSEARIVAPSGRVIRRIRPDEFRPNDQISRYTAASEMATLVTQREDPNLSLALAQPLQLRAGWDERVRLTWPTMLARFLTAAAVVLLILFGVRRRTRLRELRSRHPILALWAVAAVASIVACYPVVFFGGSFVSANTCALLYPGVPTVPGDVDTRRSELHISDPAAILWQDLPYSVVQHEALLRHGEWPLWHRYNSCGTTLLGQGQSMFGDPLHLVAVVADGASWAWDLKFVLARILFAAGAALAVWVYTRDWSASALVAIAAPFVGYFNFRFNHPAVFSFSYAPWILTGWACLTHAGTRRQWRIAIVTFVVSNLAVLGSGTVKEAAVLLAGLNIVGALGWCFTAPTVPKLRMRRGIAVAAAGISLVALTAPLWLTFADALPRSRTMSEAVLVAQAPRAWLIGLLDSLFYLELSAERRHYIGSANLLLGLGLAFALVQPWLGWRRTPALPALLLGVLACVLVSHQFVPAAWLGHIPLLRNIGHLHNSCTAAGIVLLTVAAGCGFHAVRGCLGGPNWWIPPAAGAVGLATLAAIYFADGAGRWTTGHTFREWTAGISSHQFFYGHVAAALAACVALVLLARKWLRKGTVGPLGCALAALSLFALLYRQGLHIPVRYGTDYLTVPMPRSDLSARSPALEAARRDAAGAPFRIYGTQHYLINGFNTVHRLESINGPDALMNPHYRDLSLASGIVPAHDWYHNVDGANLPRLQPFLDFIGMRYLITNADTMPDGATYARIGTYDVRLYRSPTAWPRAFFTDRIDRYGNLTELMNMMKERTGSVFAAVDAADEASLTAVSLPPAAAPTVVPARDYTLTANTTSFTIDAPSPGIAVLHETWLEGDFIVKLNGERVPYLRVNHAFKGVAIPAAGKHRVEMSYWPRVFTFALWVAAFGLAAFVGLLIGVPRFLRCQA